MTARGYTLIEPAGDAPREGVVLLLDARPFDAESFEFTPGTLDAEATARGLAVLHVTTGNPLDFLFEDTAVREVAERVLAILKEHGLERIPVFLAGLSLGGTRALRLAKIVRSDPSGWDLPIAAVAIADAPLDMVRLWHAELRAAEAGFHPAAADEGRWVTYLLETQLGGSPASARARYVEYSPYVFGEADGGNALHLRNLPLRAYHEPDVDWWIEHRRKSYYSMNSLDLAGLVNQLRLLGNDRAELITSHGARSGYAEGASPHTWSIVDNADLVEWFLRQPPPPAQMSLEAGAP
jgi:hypothetical protein